MLASVVGSTADRNIEGSFIMSVRFYSAQGAFSVFSALLCSAVLINVATSLFPVA